ncbi:MAG: helix-turn-helix domain-containing protein [Phycisphaera sp.]|nr:helix-turn-helix domain-containing protein [Phycisphaera sp.]
MSRVKTPSTAERSAADADASSPGSVPALDRSLDILELLSTSPTGYTLSELSDQLGFPMNAVFRITQTLLARGYLSRDAGSKAFQLTPQLLRLAPPRWGSVSLPAISHEAMTALRDETRETVQLGVLNGLEGVIIDQVEGLEALRIAVDLGLRFPLYNNAPGKLLLAHMPDARRDAVIDQIDLVRCTPRTITRKAALLRECEQILSDGYSTDYAEADEGIHCIAAPIFDATDAVVGTIWISGPAKRMPKTRFRELGIQVKAAGDRVSSLIGEMK